jgi:hypothetical protein
MRKIIPFIFIGLGLLALILYIFYYNREKRFPEANISMLNTAETQWYNAGINHYRLLVEVEFSTERRRHAVVVQHGQITEATLSYWDGDAWSEPQGMAFDQANDYTIPGLFSFLRQELNLEMREELRVDINDDPPYPRYIYFGQVWLDGEPMADSEARITVPEFELLAETAGGE